MSEPTVDVYRTSGTWAKPAGARTVDVVLVGAGSSDGTPGEAILYTAAADDLPDAVRITVGVTTIATGHAALVDSSLIAGSSAEVAAGADGLAVIITRY